MPPMRVFQHPASDMAIAFRPVSAIFPALVFLTGRSEPLESLAGNAPARIAPGRKPMALMVKHKPLRQTFGRSSPVDSGPVETARP